MTHPRHLDNKRAMAQRLADFLWANDQGSDWVAESIPIEFYWVKYVCRGAGESHVPSRETRELAVEILRDLEVSGKPKNLALRLDSGDGNDSSWGVPSPVTSSDGSTPTAGSASQQNPLGPSESSATSPAFRGEGRAAPEGPDSPHQASTDKRPAVPVRHTSRSKSVAGPDPSAPVSPRGRGGQASLPAFQKHSETSREAAIGVKARTDTLRLQVLNLLRERGPMTDEAIAQALNLPQNTARPRRVELVQMGSVIARGKASTASGRSAVTWDLVKFRVVCGWCPTLNVLEEGDRPEPVSHGICEACSQRIENERVSA